MGLSLRIFLVDDNDSLQRLPVSRYNRLLRGEPEERLSRHAGKRVRYALIVVEVVNRKPVDILDIQYSVLFLDSEGRLDRSEQAKETKLAMEVMGPLSLIQEPGQVVNARHRFAKKRYEHKYSWKPSLEMQAAIVAATLGKGTK